jgi:hypothetical protein
MDVTSVIGTMRRKERSLFEPAFRCLSNTDGWQSCSTTVSLLLRDSTAASIDLRDEILVNAEERRSGDLEGERGERKSSSCSADFIKCAGDGKPHFIKCGLGEWVFRGRFEKDVVAVLRSGTH